MRIRKFSHHFEVSELEGADVKICVSFAMQFIEYDRTPNNLTGQPNMTRIYAASNAQRSEFRFHINSYDSFISLYRMHDHTLGRLTVEEIPLYKPAAAEFNFDPKATPREIQVPLIGFVLDGQSISKLIELQTGQGKTFLALWCAAQLKVRTVIVLKGGYVERWIPDLVSIRGKPSLLGLQPDQVRVVRGLADMAQLCFDAMQNQITESVIVFSTDTLRMYQDHYESLNGEMSLFANIPPQYLWEAIGAGFKITDEIHQLFHANFKQDLYTHIPLTLSLSATMVAGDPFKKMLYDTMFPLSAKTDNGEYKRYVDVHTLLYRLDYKSQITIRWNVRGRKDYSQIEFEKSILKNQRVRTGYLDMICNNVTRLFVKRKQDKQKLLVFCGSVDMCNVVVKELRKRHGNLTINKYTSEDPYKHISEADIIVSTVGSLGTAHDIADLWQVHLTVGLGKEDTNLQVLGRLREMKNYPGCTPEMYYYACEDIDKQMRYHTTKRELFKTRVLKHDIVNMGISI